MKKLPNFVKWLIIAVVLAAMAAMMVAVNDRPGGDANAGQQSGHLSPDACHWKVNQKNETGLLESGPSLLL